jgi:hypothetical protein
MSTFKRFRHFRAAPFDGENHREIGAKKVRKELPVAAANLIAHGDDLLTFEICVNDGSDLAELLLALGFLLKILAMFWRTWGLDHGNAVDNVGTTLA